jgi:HK97 family phage major capsid protein/HK97 family phage prohead protease
MKSERRLKAVGQVLARAADMGESARGVNSDTRNMRISFASETPVETWFGDEVLDMSPGSMRIGARQTSMPLLFNHDASDILGVVEGIEVGDDRRAYADIRFGKDARGQWAMDQVTDGVLRNVSFMYRIYGIADEDVDDDTYRVTDYEPFEVSLVTVPADPTVGVGRSLVAPQPVFPQRAQSATQEQTTMTTPATAATAVSGGVAGVTMDEAAIRASAVQNEDARRKAIEGMCRDHQIPDDLRDKMIVLGATVEQARVAVLDVVLSRGTKAIASGDGANPDLTATEKKAYSYLRAVSAAVSRDWKNAGFEREVSNDIAKRAGRETPGFFMPTNIEFAQRAAYAVGTAGSGTTGGTLVANNLLAGSFIEVLRNKARVLQAGARILSGLVGNVTIPRQSGQTATYWVTEGGGLTEAEATFDSITMSPKQLGAVSLITRLMLQQSTPDIEMLARADLVAVLALGIDAAALYGPGSGGAPTGLASISGVGSVSHGTNGGTLTIDDIINLEVAVLAANAPEDALAYIANASTIGWLKRQKSTTGQYLWNQQPFGQIQGTPGEINGYPVYRSNQARGTLTKGTGTNLQEIYFGNWNELIVGEWGVLEILPNPYDSTAYLAGSIKVRAMQSLDINVRHAASFAICSDAQLS